MIGHFEAVPPTTPGYTWINAPRKTTGGGVAFLIRDDIKHLTKEVPNLEVQDQEIKWIEWKKGKQKLYIGIYYGPQEKCSDEEAERQFSQITSQVHKLKKNR